MLLQIAWLCTIAKSNLTFKLPDLSGDDTNVHNALIALPKFQDLDCFIAAKEALPDSFEDFHVPRHLSANAVWHSALGLLGFTWTYPVRLMLPCQEGPSSGPERTLNGWFPEAVRGSLLRVHGPEGILCQKHASTTDCGACAWDQTQALL